MPLCPACGGSNAEAAAFCRACGTALGESGARAGESGAQGLADAGAPPEQPASAGMAATPDARTVGGRDAGLIGGISVLSAAWAGGRACLSGYFLVALAQIIDAVVLLQRLDISLDALARAYTRGAGAGGDGAAGETFVVLAKVIGWVFFNAHQVPIVSSSGGGGSINILAQMGQASATGVPPIVYDAIPPVVLAIAGYAVAAAVEPPSAVAGAVSGASVAIGYVPLALLGAFLVRISLSGFGAAGWVGPAVGTAVVLTGVWAVVCGGVGGAVAGVRGSWVDSMG